LFTPQAYGASRLCDEAGYGIGAFVVVVVEPVVVVVFCGGLVVGVVVDDGLVVGVVVDVGVVAYGADIGNLERFETLG